MLRVLKRCLSWGSMSSSEPLASASLSAFEDFGGLVAGLNFGDGVAYFCRMTRAKSRSAEGVGFDAAKASNDENPDMSHHAFKIRPSRIWVRAASNVWKSGQSAFSQTFSRTANKCDKFPN